MARLLPDYPIVSIEQPAERAVAEALCAQLPKEIVVFHSYPWLRPHRHDSAPKESLHEGEIDFVIVHPRFGFLVVEVKGGHMVFDVRRQQWDRMGGNHTPKDPFKQAAKNMHALEKLMLKRSFPNERSLPLTRGFCVIFPDCEWTGTPPPGAVNENLFAASDMTNLGRKIEDLFLAFDRRANPGTLKATVLDGMMRALSSTFKLTPALWREIEEEERHIFRFTEQQALILDALIHHKRAAVEGVAGSGKTQLAMTKARAFADEDKRVLLLCFNKLLADSLAADLPEVYAERITVRNYHRLAHEWCARAGVPFPASEDEVFWREQAPQLLEQALDLLLDDRFDAIVVDEGQDFHHRWWDSIELLNREITDGPMYVFYDPVQQLFHHDEQRMPHLGTPFRLHWNCRNTRSISAVSGAAIGVSISVKPDAPNGQLPEVIVAESDGAQRKAIESCLRRWTTGPGGIQSKHVVILCAGSVSRSSLHGVTRLADSPLTEDLAEWKAGKGVLITSLRRFKGLEADAVILCDVPMPQTYPGPDNFSMSHLYVGCSRAKHLLCVVARSNAVPSLIGV